MPLLDKTNAMLLHLLYGDARAANESGDRERAAELLEQAQFVAALLELDVMRRAAKEAAPDLDWDDIERSAFERARAEFDELSA